ncbi:MAG: hypothetical protein ACXVH3_26025 [Solirubrobacteraceae bacterium]
MLRTIVTAVAATLASLFVVAAPGAALVTPHLIYDGFNSNAIDSSTWWSSTNQPGQVSISQTEGHAVISVAGTAANDFNGGIGTRCKARGDFEAAVSYQLPAWPTLDGVWVSLMASDTPGFNTYRASASWGDSYGSYLPPAGTTVPASGTEDSLRLSRHGSTWAAYYLDANHHWVTITSGSGPTNDTSINLSLFNLSGATPFGGQPATVALDNFLLVAQKIVCP